MQLTTQELAPDPDGLSQAADILRGGGLVAFPTETVYGLGADARNGTAVAKVYAAKGRPSFNPLIVHTADLESAQRFAVFNDTARALATAFWPGPLSMVLPVTSTGGLSDLVTAGLDTVAVRVPADQTGHALLAAFDGPVAAPSANLSGSVSPTTPEHVLQGLVGRIDAIVSGGPCSVGLESTILAVDETGVALLRAGGVAVEDVEEVLKIKVARPEDPDTPKSPGQLKSHYAPQAAMRMNATDAKEDELLLGFGDVGNAAMNLSASADLTEAAANLFSYMRRMDELATAKGKSGIAVSPVPSEGLGLAINDRLSRAAAPRD